MPLGRARRGLEASQAAGAFGVEHPKHADKQHFLLFP